MVIEPTLIDTGPLVSLIDDRQSYHQGCITAADHLSPPLLTCWLVIVEAAYLLRSRPDMVDRLLESAKSDFLQILALEEGDLSGIQSISRKYEDQSFDLTDLCLMHLAERESLTSIFTLDSDFLRFRRAKGAALQVVPIDGLFP